MINHNTGTCSVECLQLTFKLYTIVYGKGKNLFLKKHLYQTILSSYFITYLQP